jgi:hypothetical protein
VIEDFAGHPIERHVLQVLLGVVPAAVEVLEAALGGDERISDGAEISLDELDRI